MTIFAGGGTGGHLYPALAVADALTALCPQVRPFFVGARRGIEARVLPGCGLEHALLPVEPLHRTAVWRNWRVLPALGRAALQVDALFRRLRPALVVVTGGYAGAAPGLRAVMGRVPLALQEQNSYPGLTTRILSRWARQIHLGFPEAARALSERARARVYESGNPVRAPVPLDRAEARRRFDLDPGGTVVLVVGGSQGAVPINRALLDAVERVQAGILHRPPQLRLLWATGPAHLAPIEARVRASGATDWAKPVGYIDDMPAALAAADFAVSRAGAMATSEFLAWGVPAILVPLPGAAAGHQERNARALEDAGAALHLPQSGLDGPSLWHAVLELAAHPERRAHMAERARVRGRPGAAHEIARALAELLPGESGALGPSPTKGAERRFDRKEDSVK